MKIREVKSQFTKICKGNLLISEPFLDDENFSRSVVFLSEVANTGSIGFILNKPTDLTTNDALPGVLSFNFPLYIGGPMENVTLHFIYKGNAHIRNSIEIIPGVYWGGNLDDVNTSIENGYLNPNDFKFFLGYSGWDGGQLENEIEQKAWWMIPGNKAIVFAANTNTMWKETVKLLGDDFAYMANSPSDYTWN